MNIALVTYKDKGAYHAINVSNEDDLLTDFLHSKGIAVTKEIWNDPDVIWEKYDLAIIKSPWDYFDLIADFYSWLEDMEKRNVRLLNPFSILKWNADKHYLKDIEQAGLRVTPTIFLSQGQKVELADYFQTFKTYKIIVKPVVSGGAKNTFKVTPVTANEHTIKVNQLLQNEDFIVQPFLKEIEEVGEWSFLFFGAEFSHAVLKKAAGGDFRVQSTFGGTVHKEKPSQELIGKARAYVTSFAKDCLYARVDAAVVDGDLVLVELELIEPYLFLDTNEMALDHYHQALLKLIS
ncbi:RimK family alpha-L-glutamate ligase [Pedobacter sp. JCM 36344]|uniref:ATP-grasp domain-containing protein n=1 Tax=Pedobacter sp. JCM 36344 TaxID=3374280 RepID=UPI00397DB945